MNNLSLDNINKKSPYLVKQADDGDYVFQTAKGIIYGIGFIENDPIGGCETYQLSISNQNKVHASYDPNVKNTTLVIIDEFFRENLDGQSIHLPVMLLEQELQFRLICHTPSYTHEHVIY